MSPSQIFPPPSLFSLIAAQDGSGMFGFYLLKLLLCNLFRRYREALELAEELRKLLPTVHGMFIVSRFYFYPNRAKNSPIPGGDG